MSSDTKKPNSKELPLEHLATTTKDGQRVYLYPADVKGHFKNLKNYVHAILLVIFLSLPWFRINGTQAVLLDIPRRRFNIFGLQFWGHDGPMFLFVLGGFVLTLVFVTAVWGRMWCGWACPQTVFIEGIFRRIERWIEGDAFSRRKLDEASMSGGKFLRKVAKWTAFVAVTLIVTHSFLAYFVGTDELFRMIRQSPSENWASFLVMLISSGIILFDFGWFREQFCIIACPYGRFQSILMDEHSLVVAYDVARGEPRKGVSDPSGAGKTGDCVNCYRCVQVCPTGVDIRRGNQLECIACTACIDACDEVMTRLKKPAGLIRYDSMKGMQGEKAKPIRIRTVIYSAILLALVGGLTFLVSNRKPLDYVVLRAIDTPYQAVGDDVINHFKVDLNNQSFNEMEVKLEVADPKFQLISQSHEKKLAPGTSARLDFFLKFPKSALKSGHGATKVLIESEQRLPTGTDGSIHEIKNHYESEVRLVGPFN